VTSARPKSIAFSARLAIAGPVDFDQQMAQKSDAAAMRAGRATSADQA
jgi:hypothetical protein